MSGVLIWIVIVAGAGIFAWGIRGRRINDHPVCRECRFDLTGVYPYITTCPECGRSLWALGRVRVGSRRARWWMVIAGGVVLASGLGAGAVAVSGVDATRHKPLWWIVNIDMRRDDPRRLKTAATELQRRLDDGELAAAALRPAANRILAIQGRDDWAWARELGDVFENLWAAGVLRDEQTLRYMRQSLVVSLHVEEAYEAGMVRFRADIDRYRRGSGVSARYIPLCVTLDGARLAAPGGGVEIGPGPHGMILAEVHPQRRSTADWELAAPGIAKGTYPIQATIRLRYDLGISTNDGRGYLKHFQTSQPPEQERGPTEEWTVTFTKNADVLEESREVYRLVVDPELRPRMRNLFSRPRLQILGTDDAGQTHVAVHLGISKPPVGLEHEMFLRQGSREIALGEKAYWYQRTDAITLDRPIYQYATVTMRLEPEVPLELVLRPAPLHRTWWPEFKSEGEPVPVWGEEIVLPVEGVRLEGGTGGG